MSMVIYRTFIKKVPYSTKKGSAMVTRQIILFGIIYYFFLCAVTIISVNKAYSKNSETVSETAS